MTRCLAAMAVVAAALSACAEDDRPVPASPNLADDRVMERLSGSLAAAAIAAVPGVQLDQLNCGGYSVRSGADARSAAMVPLAVCGDGRFTYLLLPPEEPLSIPYELAEERPGGSVVSVLVNWHLAPALLPLGPLDRLMVIEAAPDRLVLRNGAGEVGITRLERRASNVAPVEGNDMKLARAAVAAPPLPSGDLLRLDRVIPAVLATAINTEVPGKVEAMVDRPVYSDDGRRVALPAGTRAIGYSRLSPRRDEGETRIEVCVGELLIPDGRRVEPTDGCLARMHDAGGAAGLLPGLVDLSPVAVVPAGTRVNILLSADLYLRTAVSQIVER